MRYIMKYLNWILIVFATIFGFPTFTLTLDIDPEKLLLIDKIIEEQFLPLHNIPGLALAIVNSSEGVNSYTTRSYGLRDREESISVTNNTRFLIASNSKSFTALIACRTLLEHFPQFQGDSVLDVPIIQLTPSYNFTLSDRYRTEVVTFRDLLAHRTCLASYGLGVTAGAYPSKQNRVYRYRYLEEECGFRSRFEYSSAMYIQAGELVAHIAGKPFNQMVMEFFQELGMNDSLIVNETEDYETLPNMSRGYFINKNGIMEKMPERIYNSNSGAASGGIISTADDMGKYLLFHLNKGKIGNRQVVPEEVFQWIRKPSNNLDEWWMAIGDFSYGLGLFIGMYDGWARIGHFGDLSPFLGRFALFPDKEIGIFTVLNGPGLLPLDSDQRTLQNEIFDILTTQSSAPKLTHSRRSPKNKLCTSKDAKQPTKKLKVSTMKTFDIMELVGIYGNAYEGLRSENYIGEFTISQNESDPEFCPFQIQYGLWGSGCLRQTSENANVYIIDWIGDIIKILYAYTGGLPVGDMTLEFKTENSCFYYDGYAEIEYRRNATLETFPPIPWSNSSCGPENDNMSTILL